MVTQGIEDPVKDSTGSLNNNWVPDKVDVQGNLNGDSLHESLLKKDDQNNALANQDNNKKVNGYLVSYLYGQLSSVCMMGMWWVLLSPITIAFFGTEAVGISRLVYNVALFFFSLVIGGIADKVRIFDLLIQTTVGRVIIYSLILPIGAFLLQSDTFFEIDPDQKPFYNTIFEVLFMILIFFDGIIVAASNNIAVDVGGTFLCAKQYGMDIDEKFENLQGRFDSIYSATFDGSMVLLAPLVAFAGYFFHKYSSTLTVDNNDEQNLEDALETISKEDKNEQQDIKDALLMTSSLGVAFFLVGVISLIFYCRLPRNPPNYNNTLKESKTQPSESIFKQIWNALLNFPRVMSSIWNNKVIFWRIIFFGLETGLEDAMTAVIVPLVCNQIACNAIDIAESSSSQQYLKNCNNDSYSLQGNIYVAVVVALGKIGAVLAGIFMHRIFATNAEENDKLGDHKKFGWLFWWSLLGGVSALLVPLSLFIVENYLDDWNISNSTSLEYYAILLFIPCIFIFNFLTTVPKIGFQNLLQVYAGKEEDASQIFGLLAAFTTLADAAVVTIIAFISPPYFDLITALWLGCGLYALVGLFEGIFGPRLVLGPAVGPEKISQESQHDYAKLSTDEENN